jgi:hypothetical protein
MSTSFDVTAYGAVADGTSDSTDAFVQALTEASKNGGGTVQVPAGEYRVRLSDVANFSGITVPAGCQLVGEGPERSIIRALGETADPNWNAIRMILVEGETRVAGLTIDGDKAAIQRDRFKDMSSILLRTVPDVANVVFEQLHVRNGFTNGEKEGFGLSMRHVKGATVRDVEAYDNDGSGISIDSTYYEQRGIGATVERVRCYRNGWQGVTVYGYEQVNVSDAETFENLRVGLNIEWSIGVTIRNSVTYANGLRGMRVAGRSTDIRWENVTSRANGASAEEGDGSELLVGVQTFGVPNPATGELETGYPQAVSVVNSTLEPAANRPHVAFGLNLEKINIGATAPESIVLDSPGAENWTFQSNERRERMVAGIQFAGLRRAAEPLDLAQSGRSKGAEIGGSPARQSRPAPDASPDRPERGKRPGRPGRPGLLRSLARAIGLETPANRPAAKRSAGGGKPRRPQAGRQGARPGTGARAASADALKSSSAAPTAGDQPAMTTASTTLSVSGKGSFIEYPLGDGARFLCHLRYRIATPAEWRFQLRIDGSNDVIREIRQEAKPDTEDSSIWFDSELLSPEGVNGQQTLRLMCMTDGEHALEVEAIDVARV